MNNSEYRSMVEMPASAPLSPVYLDGQDDIYNEVYADRTAPQAYDYPLPIAIYQRVAQKYPPTGDWRNLQSSPKALEILRRYRTLFG